MKTNVRHLAAGLLVLASLSSTAFAGQEFPRFNKRTPAPMPTPSAMCVDKGCCPSKLASTGSRARGSNERIRSCDKACPIATADRAKLCKKGTKV